MTHDETLNPRAALEHARGLILSGDYVRARSHLEKLLRRHPNLAEGWCDLGTAFRGLASAMDAERCFWMAINVAPGLGAALGNWRDTVGCPGFEGRRIAVLGLPDVGTARGRRWRNELVVWARMGFDVLLEGDPSALRAGDLVLSTDAQRLAHYGVGVTRLWVWDEESVPSEIPGPSLCEGVIVRSEEAAEAVQARCPGQVVGTISLLHDPDDGASSFEQRSGILCPRNVATLDALAARMPVRSAEEFPYPLDALRRSRMAVLPLEERDALLEALAAGSVGIVVEQNKTFGLPLSNAWVTVRDSASLSRVQQMYYDRARWERAQLAAKRYLLLNYGRLKVTRQIARLLSLLNEQRTLPLVSVIVPVHNGVAYTRSCLESLRAQELLGEVIVVDNASTDETPGFLARLARDWPELKVVTLPENTGFAQAANHGLSHARYDYLAVLNNDVLLPTGTLRGLACWLSATPGVGIVAPRTSQGGRNQDILGVTYQVSDGTPRPEELARFEAFAAKFREEHRGQSHQVATVSGICLLVTRAIIERQGGFDYRFPIGSFEDDDFCLRTQAARVRVLVADDLYVHHYGKRTFQTVCPTAEAYQQRQDTNFQIFKAKWSLPMELTRAEYHSGRVMVPPFDDLMHYVPLPSRDLHERTISACLIAKNEAHQIGRAIESVQGLADEIIVVDTGSTDDTIAVAERLGARVTTYIRPEGFSFSAAKNVAIEQATGEWVLFLDADERLDPASYAAVRARCKTDVSVGYLARMINYTGETGEKQHVDHWILRLFPRRETLRYINLVHEQVVDITDERAFRRVYASDIVMHHYGYRPQVMSERNKLERNLVALDAAVAENPEEPFHHFNRGTTLRMLGRFPEAIQELEYALQLIEPELATGHYPVYTLGILESLAIAQILAGAPEAVFPLCDRMAALYPLFPAAYFMRGQAQLQLNRPAEAIQSYRQAIACAGRYQTAAAVDDGLAGWKAHMGIGNALFNLGRYSEAIDALRIAYASAPEEPALHYLIARAAISTQDGELAQTELAEFAKVKTLTPIIVQYITEITAGLTNTGRIDLAYAALSEILQSHPEVQSLLVLLGDIAALRGDLLHAIQAYDSALGIGTDPLLLQRRARCRLQAKDVDGALADIEQAKQTLPQNPVLLADLGNALLARNDFAAARQNLEEAAALAPDLEYVQFALVRACLGSGDAPRALEVLEPLPVSRESTRLRALAWLGKGDPQHAVQVLSDANVPHGTDVDLLVILGQAYDALGDSQRALETILGALDMNPDYLAGLQAAGTILLKHGHYPEASTLFRRALSINPQYLAATAGLQAAQVLADVQGILARTAAAGPPIGENTAERR